MLGFENMIEKPGPNLEKSMEIILEHSKIRKDASVLRNRDLKMKIVELDVGFPAVVSKMSKDVYFSRNRQKTIKNIHILNIFYCSSESSLISLLQELTKLSH